MRSSLADKISRSRRLRYHASLQPCASETGTNTNVDTTTTTNNNNPSSSSASQEEQPEPKVSPEETNAPNSSTSLSKAERRKALARAHTRKTTTATTTNIQTSGSTVSSSSNDAEKEKYDPLQQQPSSDSQQQHLKTLAEKRRKAMVRVSARSATSATSTPIVESYSKESQDVPTTSPSPNVPTAAPSPIRPRHAAFASKYYPGHSNRSPSPAPVVAEKPLAEEDPETKAKAAAASKSKAALAATRPRLRLGAEPGRDFSSNQSTNSQQDSSDSEQGAKTAATSVRFHSMHRVRHTARKSPPSPLPPHSSGEEERDPKNSYLPASEPSPPVEEQKRAPVMPVPKTQSTALVEEEKKPAVNNWGKADNSTNRPRDSYSSVTQKKEPVEEDKKPAVQQPWSKPQNLTNREPLNSAPEHVPLEEDIKPAVQQPRSEPQNPTNREPFNSAPEHVPVEEEKKPAVQQPWAKAQNSAIRQRESHSFVPEHTVQAEEKTPVARPWASRQRGTQSPAPEHTIPTGEEKTPVSISRARNQYSASRQRETQSPVPEHTMPAGGEKTPAVKPRANAPNSASRQREPNKPVEETRVRFITEDRTPSETGASEVTVSSVTFPTTREPDKTREVVVQDTHNEDDPEIAAITEEEYEEKKEAEPELPAPRLSVSQIKNRYMGASSPVPPPIGRQSPVPRPAFYQSPKKPSHQSPKPAIHDTSQSHPPVIHGTPKTSNSETHSQQPVTHQSPKPVVYDPPRSTVRQSPAASAVSTNMKQVSQTHSSSVSPPLQQQQLSTLSPNPLSPQQQPNDRWSHQKQHVHASLEQPSLHHQALPGLSPVPQSSHQPPSDNLPRQLQQGYPPLEQSSLRHQQFSMQSAMSPQQQPPNDTWQRHQQQRSMPAEGRQSPTGPRFGYSGGLAARPPSPSPSNASSSVMGRQTPVSRFSSKSVVVAPPMGAPDLGLPAETDQPRSSVVGFHHRRLLEQYAQKHAPEPVPSAPVAPEPVPSAPVEGPDHPEKSSVNYSSAAVAHHKRLLDHNSQEEEPVRPTPRPAQQQYQMYSPEGEEDSVQGQTEHHKMYPESPPMQRNPGSAIVVQRYQEQPESIQKNPVSGPSPITEKSSIRSKSTESSPAAQDHVREEEEKQTSPRSLPKQPPQHPPQHPPRNHQPHNQPNRGQVEGKPMQFNRSHSYRRPSDHFAEPPKHPLPRSQSYRVAADAMDDQEAPPPHPSSNEDSQISRSYGGGQATIETPRAASVSRARAQFDKPQNAPLYPGQSAPPRRSYSVSRSGTPMSQRQVATKERNAGNLTIEYANHQPDASRQVAVHQVEKPSPDASRARNQKPADDAKAEYLESGHAVGHGHVEASSVPRPERSVPSGRSKSSVMGYWKNRIDGPVSNGDESTVELPQQPGCKWALNGETSAASNMDRQKHPEHQQTTPRTSPASKEAATLTIETGYQTPTQEVAIEGNDRAVIEVPGKMSVANMAGRFQQSASPMHAESPRTGRQPLNPKSPYGDGQGSGAKLSASRKSIGDASPAQNRWQSGETQGIGTTPTASRNSIGSAGPAQGRWQQRESIGSSSTPTAARNSIGGASPVQKWQTGENQGNTPTASRKSIGGASPVQKWQQGENQGNTPTASKNSVGAASPVQRWQQGENQGNTSTTSRISFGSVSSVPNRQQQGESNGGGVPTSNRKHAEEANPVQNRWRGASPARNLIQSTVPPDDLTGQSRPYPSRGRSASVPASRPSWVKQEQLHVSSANEAPQHRDHAIRTMEYAGQQQHHSPRMAESARRVDSSHQHSLQQNSAPPSGPPSSRRREGEGVECPRDVTIPEKRENGMPKHPWFSNVDPAHSSNVPRQSSSNHPVYHGSPQNAEENGNLDGLENDEYLDQDSMENSGMEHSLSVMTDTVTGFPSRDTDTTDDDEERGPDSILSPSQAERLALKGTRTDQGRPNAGMQPSIAAQRNKSYVNAAPVLPPHARSKGAFEELQKKLLKRQYDVEETSAVNKQPAQNASVVAASALEGHEEEKKSIFGDELGVSPKTQDSPRTLGELAAQSMHAIDYQQATSTLASLAESRSNSIDEDDGNDGASAVPHDSNVPPEFHSSGTVINRSHASNDAQRGLVFGDPDTYGASEADNAPPTVADRARAIAHWNGGTNTPLKTTDRDGSMQPGISRDREDTLRPFPEYCESSDKLENACTERVDKIKETGPTHTNGGASSVLKFWEQPSTNSLSEAEEDRDSDPAVTDYVSDVQTDVQESLGSEQEPTGRLISPTFVRELRHKNRSVAQRECGTRSNTGQIFQIDHSATNIQQGTAKDSSLHGGRHETNDDCEAPDPFSPSAAACFKSDEGRSVSKRGLDILWGEASDPLLNQGDGFGDGFEDVDDVFKFNVDEGFGAPPDAFGNVVLIGGGCDSSAPQDDGFGMGSGFDSTQDVAKDKKFSIQQGLDPAKGSNNDIYAIEQELDPVKGPGDDGFGTQKGFVDPAEGPGDDGFGMHKGFVHPAEGPGDDGFGMHKGFVHPAEGPGDDAFGAQKGFVSQGHGDDAFGMQKGYVDLAEGPGDDGFGMPKGFVDPAEGPGDDGFGMQRGFVDPAEGPGDDRFGMQKGFATVDRYQVDDGFGMTSGFAPVDVYQQTDDGFGMTSEFAPVDDYQRTDHGFGMTKDNKHSDGFQVFDLSGDDGFGMPQDFAIPQNEGPYDGFGMGQHFLPSKKHHDNGLSSMKGLGQSSLSRKKDGFVTIRDFASEPISETTIASNFAVDGFGTDFHGLSIQGKSDGDELFLPSSSSSMTKSSNVPKVRPPSRNAKGATSPLPPFNRKGTSGSFQQPSFTSFDRFYPEEDQDTRGATSSSKDALWSFEAGIGSSDRQQSELVRPDPEDQIRHNARKQTRRSMPTDI